MIHLKGWSKPLPSYIVEAIKEGKIKCLDIKDKYGEYQILEGEVTVNNLTISFR